MGSRVEGAGCLGMRRFLAPGSSLGQGPEGRKPVRCLLNPCEALLPAAPRDFDIKCLSFPMALHFHPTPPLLRPSPSPSVSSPSTL